MNFSIIIINYNLSNEVKNCINSLISIFSKSTFEIILVDNHSEDKSIINIANHFSNQSNLNFTFYQTEENLGFGNACNLAAKVAKAPILFFLNPDTIISTDIFENVNHQFNLDRKIGIIGLNVSESKIFDFSAGYFPNPILESFNIISLGRIIEALFMKIRAQLNKEKNLRVQWVMGAALFIRKELFELVDAFDSQYFLYFEEMDLCKKVIQKEWDVRYLSNLKVKHIGSVSTKKNYYFFTKMFYKGKLLFLRKHGTKFKFNFYKSLLSLHFNIQLFFWGIFKSKRRAKVRGKIRAFREVSKNINSPEKITKSTYFKKKVVINLLMIRSKIAGGGKYAQKIVESLSKIDDQNDYYLFVSEQGKQNFEINSPNFHFKIASFNPDSVLVRIFWEQLILPIKIFRIKPDVIFTPTVATPLLYNGNFLTTIHDLAYKSKTKYSLLRRIYVKFVTLISAKKSSTIFTVSNFSKAEIEKEFKLKEPNIILTYNGVEDIFFKEYDEEEKYNFIKKYNLKNNFILYVGAIEPGKNLDKLFEAFAKLLKIITFEIELVITAGMGWNQEFVLENLNKLGIQDKVHFLPYISEKELPILYKTSAMLAYLSSYEGFGIPVLEALAAGTPVLTSDSAAIAEFAGDSVVSVNPENIDLITSNMLRILTDKKFVQSKIKIGNQVAQNFRWDNSAKIIHKQIISC